MPPFKDLARGGSYRHDGRLLVAGCDQPIVRVFNTETRAPMRQFEGHSASVHVARFGRAGDVVMSGSDDKTARLWDVVTGECTACLRGHTDYIRSGAPAATGGSTWITGSYDGTVKVWDARAGSAAASSGVCVMEVDHGAPVTSVVALPAGSLIVTAGGNEIKVWDLLGGGRLFATVSAHQKTVTSLCLTAQGDRLVSGGLDGHIKAYTVGDFRPVFGLKQGGAITSVAIAPDTSRLVVGTADGIVTVRQRTAKAAEVVAEKAKSAAIRGGTYRFFLRGAGEAPDAGAVTSKHDRRVRLARHDQLLRSFQYGAALDTVLESGNATLVVSLLEELVHRGGLQIALSGRDEESLEPLLSFLIKYTPAPKFSSLLTDVTHAVLDMYAGVMGRSARIDSMFSTLHSRLRAEMGVQRELLKLQGALDLLLNASGASSAEAEEVLSSSKAEMPSGDVPVVDPPEPEHPPRRVSFDDEASRAEKRSRSASAGSHGKRAKPSS
jgi:U3 small nucleolar RNA-associated protein 15